MIFARITHKGIICAEFKVGGRVVVIGRSDEVDIKIDDIAISKIHCQLVLCENKKIIFKDLDSKNGSYHNRSRISETIMKINDVIFLGHYELSLVEEEMTMLEKKLIGKAILNQSYHHLEFDFSQDKKEI